MLRLISIRSVLFVFAVAFAYVGDAQAQWGAPPPRPGQPERPCGPDSLTGPLRFLIPQGFYGAEFRSACIRHDACYDKIGVDRMICERNYRADLIKSCDCSKFPRLCRSFAKFNARNVKRFGQGAFDSAQKISRQKAGMN